MVEFALVAPVLFALLFGTLDGGLLVFSVNQADHAADVASFQVAAQGDYYSSDTHQTADTVAWSAMKASGFGNTYVQVTSMTVTRMLQVPTGGAIPGGTCSKATCLVEDDSCHGACSDRCVPPSGSCSGTWVPCGCGARNTTRYDADFARLDLAFSYTYLFAPSRSVGLTETRYFRLEPQS